MEKFQSGDRDTKIMLWQESVKQLARAKELEAAMRKHIVDNMFTKQIGTENIELGAGYKLKAVKKVHHRLGAVNKVDAMLDRLENWQAERLVSWTPKLKLSEYKLLDDATKKIVDEVVTVVEATPTLELVPPKTD